MIVWFLLVAGIILAITGFSIYRSAESYLFEQFKRQQSLLAESTAAFIDGAQHQRFVSKSSMNTRQYRLYNRALVRSIKLSDQANFIYTLNIDNQTNKPRYAIIPDLRESKLKVNQKWFSSGDEFDEDGDLNTQILEFYNGRSHGVTLHLNGKANGLKYLSLAIIYSKDNDANGVLVVESSYDQVVALKEELLESMLVTDSRLMLLRSLAPVHCT